MAKINHATTEEYIKSRVAKIVAAKVKASPGTYRQIGMLWRTRLHELLETTKMDMEEHRGWAGYDRKAEAWLRTMLAISSADYAVMATLESGKQPSAALWIGIGSDLRELLSQIKPGDFFGNKLGSLRQANAVWNQMAAMLRNAERN